MAFRVFLSHSSKDDELLDMVERRLKRNKFEPYAFEWDPRPGEYIPDKITDAIQDSHVVVVLLTQTASESAYVHQELGFASAKDIPIIPLVEEGADRKLAMLDGIEYI